MMLQHLLIVIEILKHIIGICHDNHAHFDLIDLIVLGVPSSGGIAYITYRIKNYFKK